MARKKLTRSRSDRKVAGVAGGMAEYLDIDVTFLRLAWLVFIVSTTIVPGLLLYVLAAAVMPEEANSNG